MKRISIMIASVISCIALLSCSKETFRDFDASYSYKMSGTLVLNAPDTPTVKTEVAIVPEEGQLRLIDKQDGNVFLSFNTFHGNVTLVEAALDGKDLSFREGQTTLVKLENELIPTASSRVDWSGTGNIYDNAIIFNLKMEGNVVYKDKTMNISDSHIECVALRN